MRASPGLLAGLLLGLSACGVTAPWRSAPPDEPARKVAEAEAQVKAGAYPAAARLFGEVVRREPAAAVHDRALFGLARVLVSPDHPGRDYRQAHALFDRLLREHAGSPLAAEARAWRSVLGAYLARTEELERLKRIDLELERRRSP